MSVTNARYEDCLNNLGSFKTIQEFWRYFNFLTSIEIPVGSSISIFKAGSSPRWEDKSNRKGGRWIIELEDNKESVYKIWIDVLIHLIGEQFDFGGDITGALISRKIYENISGKKHAIYIWTRSTETEGRMEAIQQIFPNLTVYFKSHNSSGNIISPFSSSTPVLDDGIVSPLMSLSSFEKINGNASSPKGIYVNPFKRSSSTSSIEQKRLIREEVASEKIIELSTSESEVSVSSNYDSETSFNESNQLNNSESSYCETEQSSNTEDSVILENKLNTFNESEGTSFSDETCKNKLGGVNSHSENNNVSKITISKKKKKKKKSNSTLSNNLNPKQSTKPKQSKIQKVGVEPNKQKIIEQSKLSKNLPKYLTIMFIIIIITLFIIEKRVVQRSS